jgi:delta-aminolevulinic acid dehydratase/porphobilinogen synthase
LQTEVTFCFLLCRDEDDAVQAIKSMPGISRYGINKLQEALTPLVNKGLKSVLIFGVPGNVKKVHVYLNILSPSSMINRSLLSHMKKLLVAQVERLLGLR